MVGGYHRARLWFLPVTFRAVLFIVVWKRGHGGVAENQTHGFGHGPHHFVLLGPPAFNHAKPGRKISEKIERM